MCFIVEHNTFCPPLVPYVRIKPPLHRKKDIPQCYTSLSNFGHVTGCESLQVVLQSALFDDWTWIKSRTRRLWRLTHLCSSGLLRMVRRRECCPASVSDRMHAKKDVLTDSDRLILHPGLLGNICDTTRARQAAQ